MNYQWSFFRMLDVALYAIFVGIVGILVQAIVQLTVCTIENKIRVAISLLTLLMNFVASLGVFFSTGDIHDHKHWRYAVCKTVFLFTGVLSPYSAFYVLLPQWVTWHGFAIICSVLTFVKSYNMLKFMFTWLFQKNRIAIKYVIDKFSLSVFRCELPVDVSV